MCGLCVGILRGNIILLKGGGGGRGYMTGEVLLGVKVMVSGGLAVCDCMKVSTIYLIYYMLCFIRKENCIGNTSRCHAAKVVSLVFHP